MFVYGVMLLVTALFCVLYDCRDKLRLGQYGKLNAALPRAKVKLAACAVTVFLLGTTLFMNYHLDHSDVFPYQMAFGITEMEDYLGHPAEALPVFRKDYARN